MRARPVGGRSVALVVDNPQRDLAGLALVARALCERGVTVYLVPATLRARELFALAPDLVVLFHFRRGFEALVGALAAARVRLVVLDTEGGVWPDPQVYLDLQIREPTLRGSVRAYCAWGGALAGALVAGGVYAARQVRVTGSPRFDVYAGGPDRGAARAAAGPPTVLLNANYTEANPRFTSVETALDQLRRQWGWGADFLAALVDAQRTMLAATIETARALAADCPDATIVLRPHPFESPAPYHAALDGTRGVVVDSGGTIHARIRAAAATIQRTSTTAVESALAGTPALQPVWWPTAMPMPVVDAVSERCADYGELLGHVRAALDGRYAPSPALAERRPAALHEWFHVVDGQAHRRVAEVVLAELPEGREVDDRACRRWLHGVGEPHPWRKRAPRLLRQQLGLPPEFSFRRLRTPQPDAWLASDQRFTPADVRAALAAPPATRRVAPAAALHVRPAHELPGFGHRFSLYSVALAAPSSAR